MKFLLIIFFILFSQHISANTIDDLKSDEDVKSFVVNVYPKFLSDKYTKFKIESTDTLAKYLDCDKVFEDWKMKNWEISDVNNDGINDLLFIYKWYNYTQCLILGNKTNNYKLITLSRNYYEDCEFAKSIKIKSKFYLKTYQRKNIYDTNSNEFKYQKFIDTLIIKDNELIELNKKPARLEIKSIKFNTSYCFGSCPVFELYILKDGNSKFTGKDNVPCKGNFTKKLDSKAINELSYLINYINVNNLKNNYSVDWTDSQTVILTIEFKNGMRKEITDYGAQGNYGLSSLYLKLFKIAQEIDWNKKN